MLFSSPQGGGASAPAAHTGQGKAAPAKAQEPAPPAAAAPPSLGLQFDRNNWPVLPDAAPRPTPALQGAVPVATTALATPAVETAPVASGTEFGSPLLDVFAAVRSASAFKSLGGVTIGWRLTVFGAQGETIGVRELTHTADVATPDRDRLEFTDGRVYGRVGSAVFAERQGMPWPTLAEAAAQELELFGVQARLPWLFADSTSFAVLSSDYLTRGGEKFRRLRLERRPADAGDRIGPEAVPRARDRFELWCDPQTGMPREFVHEFASAQQPRRLLLEDWREGDGVRMPWKRIYCDAAGRPTTMLEITRVTPGAHFSDREFRMH